MILIFILVWFGVLGGMEQEEPAQPVQKKPAWIPSLLDITLRAIGSHILDKKITIEKAREELPDNIFQPIEYMVVHAFCEQIVDKKMSVEDARKNLPAAILKCIGTPEDNQPRVLKDKDIEYYRLGTITPDHRYLLVDRKQGGLARLDLVTNKIVTVDNSKESALKSHRLSPSGKLLALVSFQKLLIKDIDHNEVIAQSASDVLGTDDKRDVQVTFVGENALLAKKERDNFFRVLNKNNLEVYTENAFKYMGVLQESQAYITFNEGTFLITRPDGKVKKSITMKQFEKLSDVKPAIYEPALLIAYELAGFPEFIFVTSLAGNAESVIPLTGLKYPSHIGDLALAFANKGQWLVIAGRSYLDQIGELTIWNWKSKDKQQIYKYEFDAPVSYISCTDDYISHPCLVDVGSVIYSFDPIKAVAADMLFPPQLQKTTPNSNNNNNKVNNSVFYILPANYIIPDNRLKPKTSMERDK